MVSGSPGPSGYAERAHVYQAGAQECCDSGLRRQSPEVAEARSQLWIECVSALPGAACLESPARAELTRLPAKATMRQTMRIVCMLLTHVKFLSALTPTRLGTVSFRAGRASPYDERSLARLLRYDGFGGKTSQEM